MVKQHGKSHIISWVKKQKTNWIVPTPNSDWMSHIYSYAYTYSHKLHFISMLQAGMLLGNKELNQLIYMLCCGKKTLHNKVLPQLDLFWTFVLNWISIASSWGRLAILASDCKCCLKETVLPLTVQGDGLNSV